MQRQESNIGDVRDSVLSEAQFQALNGSGWVLWDGRSIVGSKLAVLTGWTNLPGDARGTVSRAKNNGRSDGNQDPAGDLAIGTYQNDQMQGHIHNVPSSISSLGSILVADRGSQAGTPDIPSGSPITDGTNGTPRVGPETRSKSTIVNRFIKIN